MHLLLAVSLLSLFVLPGCWNPFSKSDTTSTECCGCSSSDDATVCQDVCAQSTDADAVQDPMLDAARVTDETHYSASDKQ